ncbi:MAG: LamG-like jellyroll fold domain-containing protein [Planctomycetota bacterium]
MPEFGVSCGQAAFYDRRVAPDKRQGRRPIPPAAHVEFAVDCTVRKCRFAHLGGSGLALRSGSHRNRIEGCEFADIAANGVNIGETRSTRRVVENGRTVWKEDPDKLLKKNVVSNCFIHECGAVFYGAVGMWAGITDGTVIRHCEIRDLPYTGVSIGWRWDTTPTACANNLVENCHIHHVMQLLSDGGGIYTLGRQPGTVLRGNHIHDVPANAGRAESNGMFLDQGTSLIRIEDNVLHSIAKSALRFHRAEKNTVRGNTIFLSKNQKPYMFNACSPDTMTFDDKLVSIKLLTTGGKIGRGLKCDGAGSHLAVPHRDELEPEELTLAAWVKLDRYPTGKDKRRWIAGKNAHEWTDGHYAIVIADRTARAVVNIGGTKENDHWASAEGKLTLDEWHHLAMTYDGEHLRAYLDGTSGAPVKVDRKRRPGRGPFDIGRRPDAFVTFDGAIDEVRLYKRALGPAEIREHAARPAKIKDDDALIRHWDFEIETKQPAELEQTKEAGLQPRFRKLLLRDEEGAN